MSANPVTALSAKLAELRRALPNARNAYSDTLDEIIAVKGRIDYLRSAPLTRADTAAELIRAVHDAKAEALASVQLVSQIEWTKKYAGAAIDGEDKATFSPLQLPKLSEAGIAFLLALVDPSAAVKAMAPAIAAACDDGDAGPPLLERGAELATLAKRLGELEEQKTSLQQVLVAAGEDLDKWLPKPAKQGPQPGDKLPPTKDHHGRWVQGVWTIKQMPGDPRATTAGWEYRPCDPPGPMELRIRV